MLASPRDRFVNLSSPLVMICKVQGPPPRAAFKRRVSHGVEHVHEHCCGQEFPSQLLTHERGYSHLADESDVVATGVRMPTFIHS